jgi:hypothetical protein
MGGKGSGGRRVGAGRKSNQTKLSKLRGSRQRGVTVSPVSGAVSVADIPMPDDLPQDQAAVWMELAPLALRSRTLVEETAGSFRDLCRVIALRNKIERQIETDGLMAGEQKHPLLTDLRTYEQRVEAGRQRFLLAPMGKPILPESSESADPFGEFDGELRVVKGGKA